MSVLYRGNDGSVPRLAVESDIDSAVGVDNVLLVRLIENQHEFARVVAFTDDGVRKARSIRMRLTADDLDGAARAMQRIADEMRKRAAEKQ